MEEGIDEIKLEALEDFINENIPINVQEVFSLPDQKEVKSAKLAIGPVRDMNMMDLKSRLEYLETEVDSLRSELRLMKRKFRDVDPYHDKYRKIIEEIVADTLDNQCYWKTVRFDPRASGRSSSRRSRSRSLRRSRKNIMSKYNDYSSDQDSTNSFVAHDTDRHRIDSDDDYEVETTRRRQKNTGGKTPQFKRIVSGGNTNHNGQAQKFEGTDTISKPRRNKTIIQQAARRASEVGPHIAGREFNVPESSVRYWLKKSYDGQSKEISEESNSSSIQNPPRHAHNMDENSSTERTNGRRAHAKENQSVKRKYNPNDEDNTGTTPDPEFKSKMDWDRGRKQLLIQLVRERPALWDPSHEEYTKKNSRDTEWEHVAEIIGDTTKEAAKSHFRSLRVNYMAEKRKSEQNGRNGRPSKWLFFNDLKFLNPVLNHTTATHHKEFVLVDIESVFDRTQEEGATSDFNEPDRVRSWKGNQSTLENESNQRSSRSERGVASSFEPIFGTSMSSSSSAN